MTAASYGANINLRTHNDHVLAITKSRTMTFWCQLTGVVLDDSRYGGVAVTSIQYLLAA